VSHTLLLADDSVTIQRVVELTFSGEDVRVISVGDGEEAMARIARESPDIVLADIDMPKRSGYDVAAFVKGRADLAHIPVLLLAGAFEPVDHARARRVACDGVLVKPFEPRQLVSQVRRLVARPVGSSSLAAPEAVRPPVEAVAEDATVHPPQGTGRRLPADGYFDRLEAAFERLGNELERPLGRPTPVQDPGEGQDVLTLDRLLGITRVEATAASAGADEAREDEGSAADGGDAATVGRRSNVGDVFAALFHDAEQESNERGHPQARAETDSLDDLIEKVTRRVLDRLSTPSSDELLTRIVTEVAERLVRDEIGRLKGDTDERS
jgi:CheY-like chemotaxis protein